MQTGDTRLFMPALKAWQACSSSMHPPLSTSTSSTSPSAASGTNVHEPIRAKNAERLGRRQTFPVTEATNRDAEILGARTTIGERGDATGAVRTPSNAAARRQTLQTRQRATSRDDVKRNHRSHKRLHLVRQPRGVPATSGFLGHGSAEGGDDFVGTIWAVEQVQPPQCVRSSTPVSEGNHRACSERLSLPTSRRSSKQSLSYPLHPAPLLTHFHRHTLERDGGQTRGESATRHTIHRRPSSTPHAPTTGSERCTSPSARFSHGDDSEKTNTPSPTATWRHRRFLAQFSPYCPAPSASTPIPPVPSTGAARSQKRNPPLRGSVSVTAEEGGSGRQTASNSIKATDTLASPPLRPAPHSPSALESEAGLEDKPIHAVVEEGGFTDSGHGGSPTPRNPRTARTPQRSLARRASSISSSAASSTLRSATARGEHSYCVEASLAQADKRWLHGRNCGSNVGGGGGRASCAVSSQQNSQAQQSQDRPSQPSPNGWRSRQRDEISRLARLSFDDREILIPRLIAELGQCRDVKRGFDVHRMKVQEQLQLAREAINSLRKELTDAQRQVRVFEEDYKRLVAVKTSIAQEEVRLKQLQQIADEAQCKQQQQDNARRSTVASAIDRAFGRLSSDTPATDHHRQPRPRQSAYHPSSRPQVGSAHATGAETTSLACYTRPPVLRRLDAKLTKLKEVRDNLLAALTLAHWRQHQRHAQQASLQRHAETATENVNRDGEYSRSHAKHDAAAAATDPQHSLEEPVGHSHFHTQPPLKVDPALRSTRERLEKRVTQDRHRLRALEVIAADVLTDTETKRRQVAELRTEIALYFKAEEQLTLANARDREGGDAERKEAWVKKDIFNDNRHETCESTAAATLLRNEAEGLAVFLTEGVL